MGFAILMLCNFTTFILKVFDEIILRLATKYFVVIVATAKIWNGLRLSAVVAFSTKSSKSSWIVSKHYL